MTRKSLLALSCLLALVPGFGPLVASADNAPMWESPIGLTPGMPGTTVRMVDEEVDVQVHERGSSATAAVTATFDMLNSGPDVQMLVGFPNFAYDGLPPGSEYDPVAFSPAHITNFKAWTESETFAAGVRKVSTGQLRGSDWFVWSMKYPRGKVTSVHIAYEQVLDTQQDASWYRPSVHVSYVLRTGALWNGTIGKAHIVFSAPDGGGFVGSSPSAAGAQSSDRIVWDFSDLKPTFDVETAYIYAQPWRELQAAALATGGSDATASDFLRAAQAGERLLGTSGPAGLPRAVVDQYADLTRQWAWRGSEVDSADGWETLGDIEQFFAMPGGKNHGELACWPEAGAAAYDQALAHGSATAFEKRSDLDRLQEFTPMLTGSPVPACA
jgi:hypothetical protein